MTKTLATRFLNRTLSTPLLNAAGCHDTTAEQLQQLREETDLGACVTKTITLHARQGNPYPRYGITRLGTINSNGLCNHGLAYYLNVYAAAKTTQQQQQQQKTPLILSLSAMALESFCIMLDMLKRVLPFTARPTWLEINISCPNLDPKAKATQLKAVLDALRAYRANNPCILGLKLAPYFHPSAVRDMANVLNTYDDAIQFVTCSNSLPRGLLLHPLTDQPLIKPNQGFGGVGGAYFKPTALANVCWFRNALRPTIRVIGCGGVRTGRDVYEHLVAGADLVQVGSTLMREGPSCFARLARELEGILDKKGYDSVETIPKLQCKL